MIRTWRSTPVDLAESTFPARSMLLKISSLVLLTAVAYATTPLNFWVADDYNYIFPKGLDRVVSFFDPTVPSRAFYRPMNWTSWAIDYALYGKSPFGWHVSSVLFHAATTLLVAFIVYNLLRRWWAALLAGALFAVHPAHTETVSWIGGRADLVCGLFYFSAILFFVIYLRRRADNIERKRLFYALAFVMAVGALLGKEIGITVPVMLVLTDLFMYPARGWRSKSLGYWLRRAAPHIPFFALAGAYGLLRFYLVAAHIVTNTYSGPSLLSLGGILDATASNMLLMIGLPNAPELVPALPTFARVAVVLAGLAVAAGLWRWLGRWGLYSLLWMALTLLPTANLSQMRWLYVPSFGVCLLGALASWRLLENGLGTVRNAAQPNIRPRQQFVRYAVPIALLLLWGLGTIYQNVMWYRSGEEAKSILRQIEDYVPDNGQPVTIYFAGAPSTYDTVLLFNTGLPSAMSYIFGDRKVDLHEVEQPLPDPVVQDALANPPKLGPNPLFLGYKKGVVEKYLSIQALVQAGLKKQ